jgi:sugar lactone lactonase YvrE
VADIRLLLRAGALNGETPIWCAARRRLFWVDIRAPAPHLFDPITGRDESWHIPAWVGCYGLTERGAIVALRTGLFDFALDTGALIFLAPPPFDSRRFAFNDGRKDPSGRLLIGTCISRCRPATSSAISRRTRRSGLMRATGAGRR